jgi:hypothetical protein
VRPIPSALIQARCRDRPGIVHQSSGAPLIESLPKQLQRTNRVSVKSQATQTCHKTRRPGSELVRFQPVAGLGKLASNGRSDRLYFASAGRSTSDLYSKDRNLAGVCLRLHSPFAQSGCPEIAMVVGIMGFSHGWLVCRLRLRRPGRIWFRLRGIPGSGMRQYGGRVCRLASLARVRSAGGAGSCVCVFSVTLA